MKIEEWKKETHKGKIQEAVDWAMMIDIDSALHSLRLIERAVVLHLLIYASTSIQPLIDELQYLNAVQAVVSLSVAGCSFPRMP